MSDNHTVTIDRADVYTLLHAIEHKLPQNLTFNRVDITKYTGKHACPAVFDMDILDEFSVGDLFWVYTRLKDIK